MRIARRLVVAFVVLAIGALSIYGVAYATTGHSFWSRVVAWQNAMFSDWRHFPARAVANDPAHVRQLFNAPGADQPWPNPVAVENVSGLQGNLEGWLTSSGAAAFLVLHGDQILYEHYFNGYSADSTMTSFSTVKSFVSAMIGRAIEDGLIGSADDPIVDYLPELRGSGLESVTIANLLEMASGIHYEGSGSGGLPWQDDARTYYDPELRQAALTGRSLDNPPGSVWQYNNWHPILLGLILERATGMHVADYLSQTIWQPIGAEASATWSLDSNEDAFEKMESGLNGRARDFARFGLLYAAGGAIAGRQIIPANWVATSTQAKVAPNYGYMWWIDRASSVPAFAALGNLGQMIYVVPSRDIVVVRFGEHGNGTDLMAVAREIAAQVDSVTALGR